MCSRPHLALTREKHYEITDCLKFVVERILFVVGEVVSSTSSYIVGNIFQIFRINKQIFHQAIRGSNWVIHFAKPGTHDIAQLFINGTHNPGIDLMKVKTAAKCANIFFAALRQHLLHMRLILKIRESSESSENNS